MNNCQVDAAFKGALKSQQVKSKVVNSKDLDDEDKKMPGLSLCVPAASGPDWFGDQSSGPFNAAGANDDTETSDASDSSERKPNKKEKHKFKSRTDRRHTPEKRRKTEPSSPVPSKHGDPSSSSSVMNIALAKGAVAGPSNKNKGRPLGVTRKRQLAEISASEGIRDDCNILLAKCSSASIASLTTAQLKPMLGRIEKRLKSDVQLAHITVNNDNNDDDAEGVVKLSQRGSSIIDELILFESHLKLFLDIIAELQSQEAHDGEKMESSVRVAMMTEGVTVPMHCFQEIVRRNATASAISEDWDKVVLLLTDLQRFNMSASDQADLQFSILSGLFVRLLHARVPDKSPDTDTALAGFKACIRQVKKVAWASETLTVLISHLHIVAFPMELRDVANTVASFTESKQYLFAEDCPVCRPLTSGHTGKLFWMAFEMAWRAIEKDRLLEKPLADLVVSYKKIVASAPADTCAAHVMAAQIATLQASLGRIMGSASPLFLEKNVVDITGARTCVEDGIAAIQTARGFERGQALDFECCLLLKMLEEVISFVENLESCSSTVETSIVLPDTIQSSLAETCQTLDRMKWDSPSAWGLNTICDESMRNSMSHHDTQFTELVKHLSNFAGAINSIVVHTSCDLSVLTSSRCMNAVRHAQHLPQAKLSESASMFGMEEWADETNSFPDIVPGVASVLGQCLYLFTKCVQKAVLNAAGECGFVLLYKIFVADSFDVSTALNNERNEKPCDWFMLLTRSVRDSCSSQFFSTGKAKLATLFFLEV